MFDRKKYYIENKEKILRRGKQRYKDNPERAKEYDKQWRKDNSERLKEQKKRYYEKNYRLYYMKNVDEINKRRRQYRKVNPDKIAKHNKTYLNKNREKINLHVKNRRKIDLRYNLNYKMKKNICICLKGNKNGRHWETLVSYTLFNLIKRLKETMPKGYTWKDFLSGELHIDHIIPISAFNFTKSEHTDFKRCWALKNLRLLPAKENLIKGSKLLKPFQPALKISFK